MASKPKATEDTAPAGDHDTQGEQAELDRQAAQAAAMDAFNALSRADAAAALAATDKRRAGEADDA